MICRQRRPRMRSDAFLKAAPAHCCCCAALNVWLALLVFAVNPKNLDTRLGIVVTLFLSLTALIFVVTAGLPESSTVMPVQQAVLVRDERLTQRTDD